MKQGAKPGDFGSSEYARADPRTKGLLLALRALTALVLLGSIWHATWFAHAAQDDAFISYRYATNFVDLGSLTFNGPGFERVEIPAAQRRLEVPKGQRLQHYGGHPKARRLAPHNGY